MIYVISGGASKDILVGDQVVLTPDGMDDLGTDLNADGTYGYKVMAFDAAAVNLQVQIKGVPTWLTASQITSVWRKI